MMFSLVPLLAAHTAVRMAARSSRLPLHETKSQPLQEVKSTSRHFAYEGPTLAVDAVCFTPEGKLILIERLNAPYGFALPGGIAEKGETTEQGVIREVSEEIGCKFNITKLIGVYSDPARDPRGHTVSIVYAGWTSDTPKASSDAKAVRIVTIDEALGMTLAFDHAKILKDVFNVAGNREDSSGV